MKPAEAAEVIGRSCPDCTIDSIELLGEGDFCRAFLVNRVWIFRFAKHEKASASLRREACLLPLIAKAFQIRIPVPEIFEPTPSCLFVRYPFLAGPALTKDRYLELDESSRERCASQVADFVKQLHEVDLTIAEKCGIEAVNYGAEYRNLLQRAEEHLFVKLSEAERRFAAYTIKYCLDDASFRQFEPALLHGDLSPDHVMFDEGKVAVASIIDFGDMVIGDPAADIVLIYEDYGLDFLNRFLRRYGDTSSVRERIYGHYVLGAIDWAVQKAEQQFAELEVTVQELRRLISNNERELMELLGSA